MALVSALIATTCVVFSQRGAYADAAVGESLSAADVQMIIAQAVGRAQGLGVAATIAVTDREGNVLGAFQMNGARADTTFIAGGIPDPDGLEQVRLPLGAAAAAVSKAGTAAYLSSGGNAFTTRTASFIIQENFPPRVTNQPPGPLFGAQFSQLPCSDVTAHALPLGLSGDPGGVPIYKNGIAVGGVGVEGDGYYSIDTSVLDEEFNVEEAIAVAATWGYEAPASIRADNILIDGMRLDYVNVAQAPESPASLADGTVLVGMRASPASRYQAITLDGIPAKIDPQFFPPSAGSGLTAGDVTRILTQAMRQAARTQAAIRLPVPQPTEITASVVDASGAVLGIASTQDAPQFGFDVSVQTARTAAFFSGPDAQRRLREAGQARFADAAAADGVMLDGRIAFSSRAIGFLSRPSFPDGQDGTTGGPFSRPADVSSPFDTGLQLALVRAALLEGASGAVVPACSTVPGLRNGMQIFAGGVPIYRDGMLVGAIGISGDGIDQDDFIAAAGSVGFEAPPSMTSDQVTVRGVRLPYLTFPA